LLSSVAFSDNRTEPAVTSAARKRSNPDRASEVRAADAATADMERTSLDARPDAVAVAATADRPATDTGADSDREAMPSKPIHSHFEPDEFFGQQPTPRASLPSPEPLIENLTRCVIEILAGARDLEQIARWVSDDVYRHLLKRVVLSTRARQAKGARVKRPLFSIGSLSMCEPKDGVVEAVVIVHGRARTRAVAIRLEGLDHRWRATAINVL